MVEQGDDGAVGRRGRGLGIAEELLAELDLDLTAESREDLGFLAFGFEFGLEFLADMRAEIADYLLAGPLQVFLVLFVGGLPGLVFGLAPGFGPDCAPFGLFEFVGRGRREESEELRQLRLANQQLQRDLNRKDKALAEAAALLVLQKKYRALWAAEDA